MWHLNSYLRGVLQHFPSCPSSEFLICNHLFPQNAQHFSLPTMVCCLSNICTSVVTQHVSLYSDQHQDSTQQCAHLCHSVVTADGGVLTLTFCSFAQRLCMFRLYGAIQILFYLFKINSLSYPVNPFTNFTKMHPWLFYLPCTQTDEHGSKHYSHPTCEGGKYHDRYKSEHGLHTWRDWVKLSISIVCRCSTSSSRSLAAAISASFSDSCHSSPWTT